MPNISNGANLWLPLDMQNRKGIQLQGADPHRGLRRNGG